MRYCSTLEENQYLKRLLRRYENWKTRQGRPKVHEFGRPFLLVACCCPAWKWGPFYCLLLLEAAAKHLGKNIGSSACARIFTDTVLSQSVTNWARLQKYCALTRKIHDYRIPSHRYEVPNQTAIAITVFAGIYCFTFPIQRKWQMKCSVHLTNYLHWQHSSLQVLPNAAGLFKAKILIQARSIYKADITASKFIGVWAQPTAFHCCKVRGKNKKQILNLQLFSANETPFIGTVQMKACHCARIDLNLTAPLKTRRAFCTSSVSEYQIGSSKTWVCGTLYNPMEIPVNQYWQY